MTSLLKNLFSVHADPKTAAWQEAYMRNQFRFLGIRKPLIGKLLKPYAETFSEKEILEFWNTEEREGQYAAIWLLRMQAKTATEDHLRLYERLLREKSWWDTVDEIAPYLVGALVLQFPHLHETLSTWTEDPYLWIRRASLIYQLRFKKQTDQERLFEHCLRLKDDRDFFLRKAIGWSLREYRKSAPQIVEHFLRTHGKTLSPLSFREAGGHSF